MDNKTIINKKEIELTEDEIIRASNFHKSRKAFAIIDNKVIFNNTLDDDRDHQHWLKDAFDIDIDKFEITPRGYLRPDRIQLFVGSAFSSIDTSELSIENLEILLDKHMELYGYCDKVPVYNGVHIGKIGDIWEPEMCLGTYENRLRPQSI